MKKIFILISIFILSLASYGQTVIGNGGVIDSVVINPIICNGDPTNVIVYTNASSNASYDLEIFSSIWMHHPSYPIQGGTPFILPNLTAGTKRVIVEYPLNSGIFDTLEFTISQPDAIQNFTTSSDITCNGFNNGSISFSTFLGTAGYFYSLNGGANQYNANGSYSFNNLSPGSYTVDVEDINGCTYIGNPILITITQPAVLTASIQQTATSCFGGNDGIATVLPSGGTSPYSYLWSNGSVNQSATGLTTGSYNCIITDANACTVTQSITVTQPPSALSISTSSSVVSCNGGNNGSATITVGGGTPGYSYTWSNGQTTQTATGLSTGNYNCVITDANGCTISSGNIFISQPLALTVSTSNTAVSCSLGSNGTATVNPAGGMPGYSYSWSNGQTTQTATGLSSGNYNCTITDVNGCTITSGSIFISQPTNLNSTIQQTSVSCNGGGDGTASVNPSGGTPGYSYSWNNGASTQSISGLSFGSYTCTITDANGCIKTKSITVTQPNQVLLQSTTINDVSCYNGNDGDITIIIVGGTPGYSYSWNNGSTSQTINNLSAGTYTCTIFDANSCTIPTISINVNSPTDLFYSVTTNNVSCLGGNNGSSTLNVSGGTPGYSYSWNNGSTSQTINNLSAGTYTCTITDANGCTKQAPANISQPPTLLTLTMDSSAVSCNGGNDGYATVYAVGGFPSYTYLWSNSVTDTVITGLTSGTYTVSVTDANNCTVSQNVFVDQSAPLVVPISATDVSCNGGGDAIATANPTGGNPGYTYSWNNGITTQTITELSAGVYTVSVTDSINCPSVSSSITINQPSVITATTNVDYVSCFGGNDGLITLSLSGGNGSYAFLWSDGQTIQNASGLVAGQYTVEVTDITNCQYFFTYDVFEPLTPLSASALVVDASCFGLSDGDITILPTGGTPPYNYSWSNGQNSQALTNVPIGTYTCTITDNNGCVAYATGTVDQPQQLTLTSSSVATSCFGYLDGTATAIPSGGTAPYTYNWSNGQTTQQSINLIAGTYSVMVLDSNSCATSVSVTVGQPVQVGAVLTPTNILCNGDSSGDITVNSVTGTTGPYTYNWSDGHNDPINQNLTAGTYYVTITDGNGCSNTFSQTLTEPLVISTTLSYSDISVNGASDGNISANVSGGNPPYSYSWSGPNNYSNSNSSINSLESGHYILIITDASGCSQTFNQVINEPNCNVTIAETYTAPLCYEDMATVYWQNSGGLAPYSNTLISSDGTVLINEAQYDYPNTQLQFPSGVYDLVVEDASGCSAIWNIQISTPDSIELDLSLTDALCYNDNTGTASVIITGGTSPYNTDWGITDPNLLLAGNYNIEVTDLNGCSSGLINYTINEPSQLVVDSVITTLVSCSTGNDGTATIYGSGGVLPYTYGWSNGQTTQTAQSLNNGTYTAYIYDENNCQTIFNNVQINNAPLLNVSIQQTAVSCTNSSDGSLSSTVVTGTGPITYNWFNLTNPNIVISSDPSVSYLSAGAYSLIAADVNGCIDQGSVLLVNPNPITFGLNPNNITFNGANNGWVNTVSISGGQSPYSYFWTGPNGFTAISQNLTNLSVGTYTLIITDANGCTSSQSTIINEPNCNVTITYTATQPLCFGDNGNLLWTNSGGGGTYTNTITNLNTNAIIFNSFSSSSVSLSVGSYELKVSDQYGCVQLENIQIIELDALIANTNTTATTCFGGTDGAVTITPEGGTPGYSIIGLPNPNSLSAGIYSFILTDANSCSINQIFSISEPADITTTITSTNVSCLGGEDGTATVNINGGTAPYTYSWSPSGLITQTVTSLDAGNHYVLITDAYGCNPSSGQDLFVITEPNFNLAATFTNSDASCYSFSDGTAQIFPTGGTAPYTYLWSNGQIMQQATALVAGNYSCTVTDANGCADLFTTTINEPSEILANISVTNVSCNGTFDGSATVNPSGGSGAYNVMWFDNTILNSITGLQSGSYNVTVTDNTGCTTLENQIIFIVEQPNTITLNTTVLADPTCVGYSNGSVDVTAIGGSLPYNYNWLDSLNTTISTDSFALNLGASIYSVIVTDINGCFDTATVSLSSPDSIISNITTESTLCNGSSDGIATATPSGGNAPYSYIWSGSGSTTATSTGLNASTTYYVTITDANGCSITGIPVAIPEPDAVLMNFTMSDYNGFNVSCNNSTDGSIDVTANGGNAPYTYSADGIFWLADSTFLNVGSGWYTVYSQDANECISIDSVEIIAPDELDPNITILSTVTCSGANDGVLASIIQGGAGSYSYLWSNLGVNDSIAGLSEGFYSIEVTDYNGCTGTDTITIVPDFVMFSNITTTTISCTGSSDGTATANPSGGTPPYSYLWNNGNGTASIQGLSSGVYWCIITDANGCEITDTIQIIESATSLSIINVITTDVSCNGGDNGFASVFVNGGAQPYSYLWNDVNIQTTSNVTTLTADTFIIAITDASLCTIYDTIIISEPEQLISNVNQSNISCYGFSDGILINTTMGGVLPYSVNWQGPNAYSSNLDSIADLGIGDYILTVTDNNSCTTNATLQITEPSPLSYIVSAVNPLCYNDENGIVTLEINGGTLPYDAIYGSGINSYPTTDSIIVSGLSAGNDTLFVMDANGCIESNFINLTNPLELQTSNITSVSATCYGYSDGVVVVEVVGGNIPYEYQLLDVNNNIIGSTAAVNGLGAGEYEFIINDLNNCIISVPVTILSPNEISINQEQSCYGTLAVDVVAAVGIYNIFWENQEDSVFIDNLTPGTYNVTVIDELGCTKVDSFTIDELFEYSVYDASCLSVLDGSIEIHSISGGYPPYELSVDGNVLANDVVSSYIINDLSALLHTISLKDDIGCTLVDTINVDYVGGYDCIDEPIIISPNSDGTNDNWHPIYDIDTEIEAIILNRWGKREFYYSGNSLVFEWDGLSTNGNKLPSTDYYYIIKFKDNNYPDKTGVITLIR